MTTGIDIDDLLNEIQPGVVGWIDSKLQNAVLSGITFSLPSNVAYKDVSQVFVAAQSVNTTATATTDPSAFGVYYEAQVTSGSMIGSTIQIGINGLSGASSANYYGFRAEAVIYDNNNITGGIHGLTVESIQNGTGTVAQFHGADVNIELEAVATITESHGFYLNTQADAAGTFLDHHGLTIANIFNPGGATVTKFAGIVVPDLTATNASNLVLGVAGAPVGTFSIYNASSRQNYFGAGLGIGAFVGSGFEKYHNQYIVTDNAGHSLGGHELILQQGSNNVNNQQAMGATVYTGDNFNYGGVINAFKALAQHNGTGTIATLRPIIAYLDQGAAGTITLATSIKTVFANAVGTITAGHSVYVEAASNSGGGTVTRISGVTIEQHTVGAGNTNLLIGTGTIPAGANWSIYNSSSYGNYFAGPLTEDDRFVMKQIATPATPAAGYNALYFKSGDHLYMKNSAGTETQVDGGTGTTVKHMAFLSVLGSEPPASNYATLDTRNSHPTLDFDGSTDEEAVWTLTIPAWYAGGGLSVDTWWAFTSATSGSLRVQAAIERMDVSSLDIDADSFASFNSAGGTAPGTSGMSIKVTVTFTSGAQMDSAVAGEMIRLKIRRDADGTSGTDDITTDAELLGVVVRES